jgi:hypothetical protein
LILVLSLGALSACGSIVTTGTGGSTVTTGTSGSTVTTGTGAGHSSSGTSAGQGSSSGGTVTCVPVGDACVADTPCCEGAACYGGTCTACYDLDLQCMCGGMAVGPLMGCTSLGEACGPDGGVDAGLPEGGGACQCVEVMVMTTCE